ncbi:MAG TPA: PQQ-dependent sugar dehydrogenase [Kiritimatiellia bacterium]|nr:PQQ-dependent sugar dehydrogenase [Kiritimatiellia bacterium]
MKPPFHPLIGLGIGCLLATDPAQGRPSVINRIAEADVQTEAATFQVVQVAQGLEHPWAIAFLTGDQILITERPGRLWRIEGDVIVPIQGLPEIRAQGQGGLLDVIPHPSFPENRVIYLSYSATYRGGAGTRIARAILDQDHLRDLEVIFEMNPPGNGPVHFGSRFAFDRHGYLFVTLGERGDRDLSQRLDTHHGKVIRIHDDGRIPADNPFVDRKDAKPEIYSFGHRNQQGMVYDTRTGILWAHEHGPRGGDALHIIRPGLNYGWPLATYGREYFGPRIGTTPELIEDIVNPTLHWTPSIAPSGLALLQSDNFPGWEGNLFAGALIQQHIRRIVLEGTGVVHQEELLRNRFGRIRDVRQGPDGNLWFITDDPNGGLFRIQSVAD